MDITPLFKIESKRYGYEELFFPVQDFAKAKEIQKNEASCAWVFIKDMKPHKKDGHTVPPILLPSLLGKAFPFKESEIMALGYKPYWNLFRNTVSGEVTFGNKPSFSNGTESEKRRAEEMTVVNLERFLATESP